MEPARPSLRQNLRSLPPAAWVLFGGTFVNRLGTFVMPFIVAVPHADQGFSVPQAGLALAMYGIGGVAAQFLGGWLADRIGRKNAIGFSMLGASVITLLLWQASSLLDDLRADAAARARGRDAPPRRVGADRRPRAERAARRPRSRCSGSRSTSGGPAASTLGGLLADRSFAYLFIGDAATSAAFGVISLDRAAARHANLTARGAPSPGRDPSDRGRSRVPPVPRRDPDRCRRSTCRTWRPSRCTSRRPASPRPSTARSRR